MSSSLLENAKSLKIKAFHILFRSKVSRILQAILHTQHDASVEINQPAGLSSTHIPILGRV